MIQDSLSRFLEWLRKYGWSGYDPYDLKGKSLFIKSRPNKFNEFRKNLVLGMEYFFPFATRQFFRVKKEINAKGMGLFASAYKSLYEITEEEEHRKEAIEALQWLEENCLQGYSGNCWGYPFDWQSRIFMPRGTPSGVVTTIVGNAFWEFYTMTQDSHYLDICRSICEFFMNDLNIDHIDKERSCFSYTPLDHFHVHNANLFVAEFLIKVGQEINEQSYLNQGLKAVAYTISEQKEDGSICYWGNDQDDPCWIDHYHSGFKIRSLHAMWKMTNEEIYYKSLKNFYLYYLENLFLARTIPKASPNRLYPIDIHSCAEAILCNSTLAEDFPEANEYLNNCVPWILDNMQHPQGWFIYKIRKLFPRIYWKLKIPYIRWGQAWMLKALVELTTIESNKNIRQKEEKEK